MSSQREEIALKIKVLPEKPGVYQYFDEKGIILYVGKAKNLKKRVTSYFNKTQENYKTILLVKRIADIQYMVVDSELDALLLENNLIKKYQPRFNIQLKDDKTYPWICVKKEPFPRILSTRNIVRDGSLYFGPYPNTKVMVTLLSLIKELYPLRNCNLDLSDTKIKANKYKVCLEYHIGNCLGPCAGLQKKVNYDENITQIIDLVKGNISTVIRFLKQKMTTYAQKHEFESANEVKIKLQQLETYKAKSTIVSPSLHKIDVCTLIEDNTSAFINFLIVNNGAIIHAYTTEIKKKLNESREDILSYVIPELRSRFHSLSKELLTDCAIPWKMNDFIINIPQKGEKKQLVDLSIRNCKFYKLEKEKKEKLKSPEKHTHRILEGLKKDLKLNALPEHIECFDNSNFQGNNAVSACVVFKNAKPSKKEYRHFNVKTVIGPDDFATMEEVVLRRYQRLLNEAKPLPQLIVIDGGKGQLSAAMKALDTLKLSGRIAIIGLAKRLEEIFYPGDSLPIYLNKRSESLKVLQHIRNEAHRFGITHHRNRRSKNAISSEILEINGIGPKTQALLIKKFKSISGIRQATIEDVASIIGSAKAHLVKSRLT